MPRWPLSRPATWALCYALAALLLPLVLAVFFAGLENGYLETGKLAPGYRPMVFGSTPALVVLVMTIHFFGAALKGNGWRWLLAPLVISISLAVILPAEVNLCMASGICWSDR